MAEPNRVLEAALELQPRDRADLLEAIAASLDEFDLGEEWEQELRQRVDEIDSGQVKAVPGPQVFAQLKQRLRAR